MSDEQDSSRDIAAFSLLDGPSHRARMRLGLVRSQGESLSPAWFENPAYLTE